MRAVLILGSNMGDRRQNLFSAARRLSGILGARTDASGIIETEAVGFDGAPFLNWILCFDSQLEPMDLLHACKSVERRMGRRDEPEYDSCGCRIYHDRIIDIDILYYGDFIISTHELTIPHPQVGTRPYVKTLLAQLRAGI